ncbi:SpoIIE family protein phosphatase [Streptomyces sp. NPDC002309]
MAFPFPIAHSFAGYFEGSSSMTITSPQHVTFSNHMNASDVWETAFAFLDEEGTVIAWTQAAEQLVGYSAGEVVGRSAAILLPALGHARTMSAFVERCRERNGWSGAWEVCHQDGRMVDVSLRLSPLHGQDGTGRWLATVTDIGVPSGDVASGSVRGALLTRAPVGIVIRDPELRGTWANDVIEIHDGVSRERRLGCRPSDAWPGGEALSMETVMRQVHQSGRSKVHEYRICLPTSRGREHPLAVTFSSLQGADGRALGVCTVSVDVTDSRQVRERLAVLGETGRRLGSTLDVMQTGQELAELAVPLFADFVTVDLEQSGDPVRIGSAGRRLPVLRRAGLASIRPGTPEALWRRGSAVPMPPDSPFFEVLRTGRSYLEPSFGIASGTWIAEDSERACRVREYGMHSVMVVPIRVGRVLLGVALFVRTDNPMPFQEDDRLLAEALVCRAAVSLDNARQFTREHNAALTLQRSLLPRRLRGGLAVEAASRYLPADLDRGVGGDWFDVIPLVGARVAFVIGDVVGHGINAAVKMGKVRAAVHTLADLELAPDELLTQLDGTVQRLAEGDSDDPDDSTAAVGATCLYAIYDPATRKCTMATAGHLPPAIIDPQGQVTFPDLPTGAPLGLGMGVPFESVEVELPEGSLIALYTDGLVETRDADIEEGMHRLGTTLAEPHHSLEDLCTRAVEPAQGLEKCDDATLLLVRTRALSPDHVASWTLRHDGTAVARARDLTAGQLAEWGLGGPEDDSTELIVGELVGNAVRHSTGPIGLRLIRHRVLTVEVTDNDVAFPHARSAATLEGRGRGPSPVSRLCRRWGTRRTPEGKVVWAEAESTAA